MKKIIITGVAGLLGSNIAYLLRKKYKVIGIDRNDININGIDLYKESLTDYDKIFEILQKENPEYLIHCAALTSVDGCEKDAITAWDVNYTLTSILKEFCDKLCIKMIFLSTDAVFPGVKDGLYTEGDLIGPISVYGKTKAEAEKIVLQSNKNLVIRTNIFGFNYREKKSFTEWVVDSLKDGVELNMFYDLYFSPILVNELIEILEKCMENNVSGLYHICSTGSISKYDLGVAIKDIFSLEGKINKVSMKDFHFIAPRTQNMGLDNSKIKKLLNIHISTPKEGIKKLKELYDNNYHVLLKKGK